MAKSNSENGVWLDRDTGKVVRKEPARGRLLVSPGKEITPNVQALMDRYEDNFATVEQATAPDVVETRTETESKPKKSSSKTSKKG